MKYFFLFLSGILFGMVLCEWDDVLFWGGVAYGTAWAIVELCDLSIRASKRVTDSTDEPASSQRVDD